MYASAVNIPDAPWDYLSGVALADARASGWLLHSSTGEEIGYECAKESYLTEVGNPDYQKAFIAAIDTQLRAHPGLDGILIDNVIGNAFGCPSPSVEYPTDTAYRNAMLSFMHTVGPALRAKGWYVGVNDNINSNDCVPYCGAANTGDQLLWWMEQIGAASVDAFMQEDFAQTFRTGYPVRLNGSEWYNNWETWQRAVARAEAMSRDFVPITSGDRDTGKAMFLRGSFLLDASRATSSFAYVPCGAGNYSANGCDHWGPWNVAVGRPLGAKEKLASGVWRRRFELGEVLVNPTASSQVADGHSLASGTGYIGP
jgi:hypothetical protein